MRVWATQACPVFMMPENTSIGTEAARSTSSRRIAAEFQGARLEHLRRAAADLLPDGRAAGEGEDVDVSIGRQRLAGFDPAGHNRQHTLRQASLGEYLRQSICAQRGFGGRLE